MLDRVDKLESRVTKIEEAIIDLRVSVGGIVKEMQLLRYSILIGCSALIGIDISGLVV